jgi:hypothetical protein
MDAPIAPCDAENNEPLLVLGVKVGKTGPEDDEITNQSKQQQGSPAIRETRRETQT